MGVRVKVRVRVRAIKLIGRSVGLGLGGASESHVK